MTSFAKDDGGFDALLPVIDGCRAAIGCPPKQVHAAAPRRGAA